MTPESFMKKGPIVSFDDLQENISENSPLAIRNLPAKLSNMHCARTQGYEWYISIFDKHKQLSLRYMEAFEQIPAMLMD